MRLVLITARYPFGYGESFLEDELKVGHTYFSEIFIISTMPPIKHKVRYIPDNARVLLARPRKLKFGILTKTIHTLFSRDIMREIVFIIKMKKNNNYLHMLGQIALDIYVSISIEQTMNKINMHIENTLFYSYWLSGSSYYFFKMKKLYSDMFCIARGHGGDIFIERGYKPFRREIVKYLDEIHSISEAGKASLEQHILPFVGEEHAKLKVSRLGILKQNNMMNPPATQNMEFHIVSCSNVIQIKRLDLIVDALAQVNDIRIKWVHFGGGELMDQIVQLAEDKLRNNQNIAFSFAGQVENSEVRRYYETSHVDLFVNSSDVEGIPVSIMEALAYGIPVIARDVGGNREIVSNENGELLSTYVDAHGLSEAIVSFLLLDIDRKEEKKQAAFDTFNHKYNATINYTKFFEDSIGSFWSKNERNR